MASYPDYDPSIWVGGISNTDFAELNSETSNYPLFNRAINGLYPAGSTFKPFVAAVALDAGVITKQTTFRLRRQVQPAPADMEVTGHPRAMAATSMSCRRSSSPATSSSTTSATASIRNRTLRMQEGLRQFGFGTQTGIDLPGETTRSRVPDKTWKRETGKTAEDKLWKPGDEINLAIGQGDLLVTPLQLAVACSAIANAAMPDGRDTGGTVWVPHLGLADHRLRRHRDPSVRGRVEDPARDQRRGISSAVRKGMRLVVDDPTRHCHTTPSEGFPVAVGGKTGTSEKKPDQDYALFMGYAPADGNSEPQIVVVAVIEQGGHGSSVAAPVVRRVMEAYFDYSSRVDSSHPADRVAGEPCHEQTL